MDAEKIFSLILDGKETFEVALVVSCSKSWYGKARVKSFIEEEEEFSRESFCHAGFAQPCTSLN